MSLFDGLSNSQQQLMKILGKNGDSATGKKPADMIFENSGFSSKDKNGNVIENPVLNPDGTLKDQFKTTFSSILPQVRQELGGVNQDLSGLNAIKQRALSAPGTVSPWLALQQQHLGSQLDQMRDDSTASGASSLADATSGLARGGGLGGGASERLARQGMFDQNKARQQISRFGIDQGNNLAVQDENTKNQMLQQLPGLQNQAYQNDLGKSNTILNQMSKEQTGAEDAQKSNLQNVMNELQSKRSFDLGQYQSKLAAWGAGKTADAQANAGKK